MASHVTPRAPFGSLAKDKNLSPAELKRPTQKQRRMKDDNNSSAHLEAVRLLPCCVKGCETRQFVEAHHLKRGVTRGMGYRSDDKFTVPLCWHHHHEGVEKSGKSEPEWFEDHGIKYPIEFAKGLWAVSGDLDKMAAVLLAHWEAE